MNDNNIQIPEKSLNCITQIEFFNRLCKFKALNDGIIHIICSKLRNQRKQSKTISKLILRGINELASETLDFYTHFLQHFLSINDDLTILRIEWLVGSPYMSDKCTFSTKRGSGEKITENLIYFSTLFIDCEVDPMLQIILNSRSTYELKSMKLLKALLYAASKSKNFLDRLCILPPISFKHKNILSIVEDIINSHIFETKRFPEHDERKIIRESLLSELNLLIEITLKKNPILNYNLPNPKALQAFSQVLKKNFENATYSLGIKIETYVVNPELLKNMENNDERTYGSSMNKGKAGSRKRKNDNRQNPLKIQKNQKGPQNSRDNKRKDIKERCDNEDSKQFHPENLVHEIINSFFVQTQEIREQKEYNQRK